MAIRLIRSIEPGYRPRGEQSLGREINSIAHLQRALRRGEIRRLPSSRFDGNAFGLHGTATYLRRETRPNMFPIATAQAVAIGDAMMQVTAAPNNTVQRAQDMAYPTVIATPNAPTVADSGVSVGSPLTNATTNVKITYQFPWGEGPLSAAANATPTLHAQLYVSGANLVPPAPALWTNIYVETAAGSGVYKLWGISYGENVLIGTYGNGQAPYAGNPTGTFITATALLQAQYTFAQDFVGMSACAKDANVEQVVGYPTANQVRINMAGEYQIDLDAAYTWAQGDYFGPAANAGGTALQTQTFAWIGTYNGTTPGLDKCAVLSATNSGNNATQVTGILMLATVRPSR